MSSTQLILAAETAETIGAERANAILVIVSVVLGVIISGYATRFIKARFIGWRGSDVSLVVNIVRAMIALIVVYMIGENVFNIHMDAIVQTLGITSLVVSLGMQDLIKNLVAGVQILMSHLFTVGDQIEINGIRGEVVDVNWRQTTLRDKDGDMHVVPNAVIMADPFIERVGKMSRRYTISCDIKSGLDLDRVAADIEQLADEVLDERGWRAEEHTEVRFIGSTANGTECSVRIYLKDIEFTTRGQDAVMRVINSRGYLADMTNDTPEQKEWLAKKA